MQRRRALRILARSAGLCVAAASITGLVRGLRFPTLQFEPKWAINHATAADGVELLAEGATVLPGLPDLAGLNLQASAPEPRIELKATRSANLSFRIGNLHPACRLDSNTSTFSETGSGLLREVSGTVSAGDTVQLSWTLPDTMNYRFGVIGDSGGADELEWCLLRAHALNADFILHLGDIYYQPGDVESAPLILNNSRVPVYTAIGNHDFHKGFNYLHRDFTNTIGPRNSSFRLADVRYVNLDTAAGTFPPSRGERAAILQTVCDEVASDNPATKTVYFSHKPFTDPRAAEDPSHSHNVAEREHEWLRAKLREAKAEIWLAGHVHVSAEIDDQGLKTWIAGEGLAHRDIIARKQIARILIGEVSAGTDVRFKWEPMLMPMNIHCSERILKILREAGHETLAANFCARSS